MNTASKNTHIDILSVEEKTKLGITESFCFWLDSAIDQRASDEIVRLLHIIGAAEDMYELRLRLIYYVGNYIHHVIDGNEIELYYKQILFFSYTFK